MNRYSVGQLGAVALCALTALPVSAQSTTENSEGSGVFVLPNRDFTGGSFLINTESTSFRVAFVDRGSSRQTFYYGLEAAAKANNGMGALFNGTQVAPGAKFAVNFGGMALAADRRTGGDLDWFNVKVGYEVARLTTFDGSKVFGEQFSKATVSSPSVLASYGFMWRGSLIAVGSVGASRQNNYGELEPITINQTETIAGPAGTVRTIAREIKTRAGTLAESVVGTARLDLLYLPPRVSNRIGLAFYSDTGFADDLERGTKMGAALHLLKAGTPSHSRGAVVVEVDDVFGGRPSLDRRRHVSVFVQAALPFEFKQP